jgi:hypothetical protein
VIQQGCSQQHFDQIWERSGKEYWAGHQVLGGSSTKRIRAQGYYNAFGVSVSGRWNRKTKVEEMRPGDILVYKIRQGREYRSNNQVKTCSAVDSGHVMIVVGTPYRVRQSSKCRIGTKTLTRYRMKIADSSKWPKWAGISGTDTRWSHEAKCRTGKCGVGAGWIWAWGDDSNDGKLYALAMRPPNDDKMSLVGPKCPPLRNRNCHYYRIGELLTR